MTITTDKETYCDMDDVARGLAYIVPLKVCFRARPEVNTRIMEAIAKEFKVYQYVHEENGGIPYNSAYDFFFWCYAMPDREMNYFTLSVHHDPYYSKYNRTAEECERDFQKLREWLEANFASEECEVCFEWHTEADYNAIRETAKRIYTELGQGSTWVEYRGEVGRLYKSDKLGYCFKKKGAKKYVLCLNERAICNIRKWEKVQAA